MGQDIDGLARLFARGDRFDQRQTMPADLPVDRDIFFGDLAGALVGGLRRAPDGGSGRSIRGISSSAHFRLIAVGRVAISIS